MNDLYSPSFPISVFIHCTLLLVMSPTAKRTAALSSAKAQQTTTFVRFDISSRPFFDEILPSVVVVVVHRLSSRKRRNLFILTTQLNNRMHYISLMACTIYFPLFRDDVSLDEGVGKEDDDQHEKVTTTKKYVSFCYLLYCSFTYSLCCNARSSKQSVPK